MIIAIALVALEQLLLPKLLLRRVGYRRFFAKSVAMAGDTIEMVEIIENKKLLPVPRVLLEAVFDGTMDFQGYSDEKIRRSEKFMTVRSIFSLAPYTRITRRHQIQCDMRGIFKLDGAAMTVGGIFGSSAFKRWTLSGPGTEITIYPRLIPDFELQLSSNSFQGDVEVRRFILPDPLMRQGTRPYQPGDPLNQINWRATARTGELHVHLREFTADFHAQILLNFVTTRDMWTHIFEPLRVEAGISLAATMADKLITSGARVGFHSNGAHRDGQAEGVPPDSGYGHLDAVWSHLAGLERKVRCSFHDLILSELELANEGTDFVLITGYVDEEIQEAISSIESAGHGVTVVPLPTEEQAREWLRLRRSETEGEVREHGRDAS